ncbi:PREDICTED: zinc finger and BTB domain-containing protein 17-like [Priapulus caudatus]|uniref:Zinc finger and BTB domain-containing protein 17-like n=1 Tax=Priapulus caudatus TaxID=37621 RepID=A0ABM1F595_PRICU|nr:PREDICTED: zinc finger and BTB domain-containing protein 17-like [Priapulus caudatus]
MDGSETQKCTDDEFEDVSRLQTDLQTGIIEVPLSCESSIAAGPEMPPVKRRRGRPPRGRSASTAGRSVTRSRRCTAKKQDGTAPPLPVKAASKIRTKAELVRRHIGRHNIQRWDRLKQQFACKTDQEFTKGLLNIADYTIRVHIQVSAVLSKRWQQQMLLLGFTSDEAFADYLLNLSEKLGSNSRPSDKTVTTDDSSQLYANDDGGGGSAPHIANDCPANSERNPAVVAATPRHATVKINDVFGRPRMQQRGGRPAKDGDEGDERASPEATHVRGVGPIAVADVCLQVGDSATNGNAAASPENDDDAVAVQVHRYALPGRRKRAVHRSRATQTRLRGNGGRRGEKRAHVCEECGARYASVGSLRAHALRHRGDGAAAKCERCGFTSASRQSVAQHAARVHAENRQRSFVCEICGHGYYDRNTMLQHRRLHSDEGIPCERCGKQFKNALYLKRHRRTHADYEGTPCAEGCGKTFKSRANMLSHVVKIHSAGKALTCPYAGCAKTFRYRGILNNHVRTRHVRRDRSIRCSWAGCAKTFREKKHLDVHVRIHTDEKPLRCELCDYRCRQRNALNWHMKKHAAAAVALPLAEPVAHDVSMAMSHQQQPDPAAALSAAPPASHFQGALLPQGHAHANFPAQHQGAPPAAMQHPLTMAMFPQNLDVHYYATNSAPYGLYERHDRGYMT